MSFLVLPVVVAALMVFALRGVTAVALLAWFGVVYGLAASGCSARSSSYLPGFHSSR